MLHPCSCNTCSNAVAEIALCGHADSTSIPAVTLFPELSSEVVQTALAGIQYARSVARRCGWHPWQQLLQQAQVQEERAKQWRSNKLLQFTLRCMPCLMLCMLCTAAKESAS